MALCVGNTQEKGTHTQRTDYHFSSKVIREHNIYAVPCAGTASALCNLIGTEDRQMISGVSTLETTPRRPSNSIYPCSVAAHFNPHQRNCDGA
jgi:UDP-N-acetylmuramyl pentapeptide synthase